MKNVFSDKLKEFIHLSGIKQQSIANATGYDLSYISKWMNGKMLPSEKTIEATIEAISQCIFNGTSKNVAWLEERYSRAFRELGPWVIAKELQEAYNISKGNNTKNVSTFFVSLPSKTFYNSIYDLIDESDEIVLLIDLFAMDRESRQALIGLEDGYYKKRTCDPKKKVALIFNASESSNVCYDAIFLIHLITVFSRFYFSLTNGYCASGKAIAVAPNKIISGFIVEDKNKVVSVSKADTINSGAELQNEFLRVAQNIGFVYLKKTMEVFTNGKDYLKSMLSTNIKWIQGHITELIMPDDLHEKLLKSIENISYDEAQRIHIFSKNIIEQDSTSVLIYETALSDLIVTGEVDFYNYKTILTSEEIADYIQFLMKVVQTSNIYLISDPLFAEFKHAFSPYLYISDTISYIRIEDAYDRDNIYEIVDRNVRDLFGRLYTDIIANRKDAIIVEKSIILEHLENYKLMAGIPKSFESKIQVSSVASSDSKE